MELKDGSVRHLAFKPFQIDKNKLIYLIRKLHQAESN